MKKSPNATDTYVGTRVRMRRLMLDMSQTDLAEAVGLTFQQVQKYEKGTNRISASRLQQFTKVLKVSISFFFDGLPNQGNAPSNPIDAFVATTTGLELVRAFSQIHDPKLRRSIVKMVEELAAD